MACEIMARNSSKKISTRGGLLQLQPALTRECGMRNAECGVGKQERRRTNDRWQRTKRRTASRRRRNAPVRWWDKIPILSLRIRGTTRLESCRTSDRARAPGSALLTEWPAHKKCRTKPIWNRRKARKPRNSSQKPPRRRGENKANSERKWRVPSGEWRVKTKATSCYLRRGLPHSLSRTSLVLRAAGR